MFSRHEAAQLKKDFWMVLGQYMNPVLSAEREKVSWLNYKTGEKNIFFRLYADDQKATVSIDITHPDAQLRELYYEHFLSQKKILEQITGIIWNWQPNNIDEWGKTVSKIFTGLQDVSVYKKEDWPQLISFFKTILIVLDEFWSNVKYGFEALR